MKRELRITHDGSHTLFVPSLNEQYHSIFGALSESRHIFINYGFNEIKKDKIKVLETGFGTGLNALLTFIEGEKKGCEVFYHSLELYPLDKEIISKLNYPEQINPEFRDIYESMHNMPWEEEIQLSDKFRLLKQKADIKTFCCDNKYDIIYFDAFAPDIQPELWTDEVFKNMNSMLNNGGLLLTYSAKGSVKRTLEKTNFTVNKKPGPPGKREMIQAIKNC